MTSPLRTLLLGLTLTASSLAFFNSAHAHGDVTPQPVDISKLKPLGTDWVDSNPYRGQSEAIRVGKSAFTQNCARCHGIDAISGGIAPDLRKLPEGEEGDAVLQGRFRFGSIRNGVTYMPPFEGILPQEAAWSIRSWLDTVRVD